MTPLWYILVTLTTLCDLLLGYALCLLKPHIEKRLTYRTAKPVALTPPPPVTK